MDWGVPGRQKATQKVAFLWYNMVMISLIACISKNWGLGYKDKLLFHYPEDMTYFKNQTMGNVVVMGRKTHESINIGRLLQGRRNIIFTRSQSYNIPGAEIVHSMTDFWELYSRELKDKNVFVIGGADIYKEFLPYADEIHLTEVNQLKPADTFFPQFNKNDYIAHTKSRHHEYTITKYIKPNSR